MNAPADFGLQTYVEHLGRNARAAARLVAAADTKSKNTALDAIAARIEEEHATLISANICDIAASAGAGLEEALIDRLRLSRETISGMAEGLRQVARLPDPIGEISDLKFRPSGIRVGKMRVPLGVVGIIYESRPNVTADAAALCLKSGNACILRGGSEALHSNLAIAACIRHGLALAGLPEQAVQVVETTERELVSLLVGQPEFVDVIVPRGGRGLIERVARDSKVPVIKHLDGICHVYIDQRADIDKAVRIADNARTQRYGTCNTMETLLVHIDIAANVLPRLIDLYNSKGVELRGCERTRVFAPKMKPATQEDWRTEYLAPVLSIRIVDSLDDAIDHIATYGSQHTDAIVTEDYTSAMRFLREVDSSSVMVNASTRLADGFEYGLGAEIGISTDKFHARGPVGLEGLTSQKWVVLGTGQVRG